MYSFAQVANIGQVESNDFEKNHHDKREHDEDDPHPI